METFKNDYKITQTELAVTFWTNIKAELKAHNLQMSDLAEALGVNTQVIRSMSYMRGSAKLRMSRVLQIAFFFNRPISYFFRPVSEVPELVKKTEEDVGLHRVFDIRALTSLNEIQLKNVYEHMLSFRGVSDSDILKRFSDGESSCDDEETVRPPNNAGRGGEDIFRDTVRDTAVLIDRFYDFLLKALDDRKITINIAALSVGLSQSTLYPQFRKKVDANFYPFYAICSLYGISVDYAFFGRNLNSNTEGHFDSSDDAVEKFIKLNVRNLDRYAPNDYCARIITVQQELTNRELDAIIAHINGYLI